MRLRTNRIVLSKPKSKSDIKAEVIKLIEDVQKKNEEISAFGNGFDIACNRIIKKINKSIFVK